MTAKELHACNRSESPEFRVARVQFTVRHIVDTLPKPFMRTML